MPISSFASYAKSVRRQEPSKRSSALCALSQSESASQTLEYIHRSKTGAMIRASVIVGGIIAGATDEQMATLDAYSQRIGLAFQIADDILDVTQTSEQLGKTAGKDQAVSKATYPAIYGLPASENKARQLVEEAVEMIATIGGEAPILAAIARFIVERKS